MSIIEVIKSMKISYECMKDNGMTAWNTAKANSDMIHGMVLTGEIDENGAKILQRYNGSLYYKYS